VTWLFTLLESGGVSNVLIRIWNASHISFRTGHARNRAAFEFEIWSALSSCPIQHWIDEGNAQRLSYSQGNARILKSSIRQARRCRWARVVSPDALHSTTTASRPTRLGSSLVDFRERLLSLRAAAGLRTMYGGCKAASASAFCPKIRTTGGGRMTAWARCHRCYRFY
jgi:hypothetical protein